MMRDTMDVVAAYPTLAWAGVGVVLLIVEVLWTGGFFLSFAAAGLLLAGASLLRVLPAGPLWQLLIFAALGVALLPLCRWLLFSYFDRTPDINQY
jgi:membrane protein implicated in regulation of membrane protease activity